MTLPDHQRLEAVQIASFVSTVQDTIRLSHHPDESDEDPGFLVIEIDEADDDDAKAGTWLTPDGAIALAMALQVWANTADKMHCWRRYMEAQRRRPRKAAVAAKEASDGK